MKINSHRVKKYSKYELIAFRSLEQYVYKNHKKHYTKIKKNL